MGRRIESFTQKNFTQILSLDRELLVLLLVTQPDFLRFSLSFHLHRTKPYVSKLMKVRRKDKNTPLKGKTIQFLVNYYLRILFFTSFFFVDSRVCRIFFLSSKICHIVHVIRIKPSSPFLLVIIFYTFGIQFVFFHFHKKKGTFFQRDHTSIW